MLKCKNCGARLTKFNKEICPYCGCKNPIEHYEEDSCVTQTIDQVYVEDKNFKQHSLNIYYVLSMFLSIFSVDLFYIGKIKSGLIRLGINIAFYLVLFLTIYFSDNALLVLSLLLPFGILYLVYLIFGIIKLAMKKSPFDKKGVTLKWAIIDFLLF